jgi:hypothetical protein
MFTHSNEKEMRLSGLHRRAGAGIVAVALSSFVAFTACDSKSPSNPRTDASTSGTGGASGLGGMTNMGNMGAGGMTMTMGGNSGSGAGGAPLPMVMESGMTTAKFCNAVIAADGSSLEFVLELGTTAVRFSAISGKCTPLTGMACLAIPAGSIPFRLSFKNQTVGEGVAPIMANKPLVFATVVDNAGDLQLAGINLDPGETCEAFELVEASDAGTTPKPDASAPPKM